MSSVDPGAWTIHLLGKEIRSDRVSVACLFGIDCEGTAGEPPVPCECRCHEQVACAACDPPRLMSASELMWHVHTHMADELAAWKAGPEDLFRTLEFLTLVREHPPPDPAEISELQQHRKSLMEQRLREMGEKPDD